MKLRKSHDKIYNITYNKYNKYNYLGSGIVIDSGYRYDTLHTIDEFKYITNNIYYKESFDYHPENDDKVEIIDAIHVTGVELTIYIIKKYGKLACINQTGLKKIII